MLALVALVALAGCGHPEPSLPSTTVPAAITAAPAGSVTIIAAGDLACEPTDGDFKSGAGTAHHCQQLATSQIAVDRHPNAVLTLGDLQYEHGQTSAWTQSYGPSWGRVKDITRPVPGNHEYETAGAQPYFDYFGAAAGDPGQGWYSYNLGSWHLIALNSNCSNVGGCQQGSAQERWLRADLAAHRATCVLAYWHHPRWSNGEHGNNPQVGPLIQDLYDARAEVVLSGHDHDYERFAPLNPQGAPDSDHGLREFVVGSGGRSHYRNTSSGSTEAMNNTAFGVLSMTLSPKSYTWEFLPVAGQTFADRGSGACH